MIRNGIEWFRRVFLSVVLVGMLVALGLTACEQETQEEVGEGFEAIGREMDKRVKEADEHLREAGEELGRGVEDLTDEMEEAGDGMKEETSRNNE